MSLNVHCSDLTKACVISPHTMLCDLRVVTHLLELADLLLERLDLFPAI
jgi:hypothetical protein